MLASWRVRAHNSPSVRPGIPFIPTQGCRAAAACGLSMKKFALNDAGTNPPGDDPNHLKPRAYNPIRVRDQSRNQSAVVLAQINSSAPVLRLERRHARFGRLCAAQYTFRNLTPLLSDAGPPARPS